MENKDVAIDRLVAGTEGRLYTVEQKERIFSNNCNFFIFNIKKLC